MAWNIRRSSQRLSRLRYIFLAATVVLVLPHWRHVYYTYCHYSWKRQRSSLQDVGALSDAFEYHPSEVARRRPCRLDQWPGILDEPIWAHQIDPAMAVPPLFGTYDVTGNDSVCFTYCGRYGPYGACPNRPDTGEFHFDWNKVDLGAVQGQCFLERGAGPDAVENAESGDFLFRSHLSLASAAGHASSGGLRAPLTAVLLRAWQGYPFHHATEFIRSLVRELPLASGGEYAVFLLVEVKDHSIPFSESKDEYDKALRAIVPEELRSMSILWAEPLMEAQYPGPFQPQQLPGQGSIYRAHRSMWLVVQVFLQHHPWFDFIFNCEMDSPYIGHWLEFMDRVRAWSRAQPRHGLRERNEWFYIPSRYKNPSAFETHIATVHHLQPFPEDGWGVDEDADLITFNPQSRAQGTGYVWRKDISGYTDADVVPELRVSISTVLMLSASLVREMDVHAREGRLLASEMEPSTVADAAGLKPVYAVLPVYTGQQWGPRAAETIFNPCGVWGSGGCSRSVFGLGYEEPLMDSTFYYDAKFSRDNWRTWWASDAKCMRAALIHPVKFENREQW